MYARRASNALQWAAAGTLASALCGWASAAPSFQDAGSVGHEQFEVDVNSVRLEQGLVRFRLRSRYRSDTANYNFAADIGVDCEHRTRGEFYNSREANPVVLDDAGRPLMKPVYEGTRQAKELEMVCRLAAVAPKASEPSQVPSSPPPVLAGKRRLERVVTGFVISGDGWVLAPGDAVEGCGTVEVLVSGTSRPALIGDSGSHEDYALLKLDGSAFTALRPRGEPLPRGSALTLLGHPAGAPLKAQPRVSTAFVSGGEAGNRDGGVPWITVSAATTMSVAAVLDDQGLLVGVIRQIEGGERGRFHGRVTRVSAIRGVMEYHGIDWVPPVNGTKRAVAELLRQAVPAVVQVACYSN
ncbi:serine protease [Ideonella sp. DXS29W]|uniref:Serine protease n=1 Tax=Ideonella lacteola TaxID=2984193 RepID=A0ABU9BMH0_9BURK